MKRCAILIGDTGHHKHFVSLAIRNGVRDRRVVSVRTRTSETVAEPKFGIVNFVATAELRQSVDLECLASAPGFLYDYAVYHCAYLKDGKTKGKVAIFASGKMISIGTKSFRDARQDLKYAAKRLVDLRLIESTRVKVKLRNIVAVSDAGIPFDLESLLQLRHNLIYEPEQFPGAIYWAHELEGAAMLLFPSGKIVVAGLKRQELLSVAEKLVEGLVLPTQEFDGRKRHA